MVDLCDLTGLICRNTLGSLQRAGSVLRRLPASVWSWAARSPAWLCDCSDIVSRRPAQPLGTDLAQRISQRNSLDRARGRSWRRLLLQPSLGGAPVELVRDGRKRSRRVSSPFCAAKVGVTRVRVLMYSSS